MLVSTIFVLFPSYVSLTILRTRVDCTASHFRLHISQHTHAHLERPARRVNSGKPEIQWVNNKRKNSYFVEIISTGQTLNLDENLALKLYK